MSVFDVLLVQWRLWPDGDPIHTRSSDLLPVLTAAGLPAMLKRARAPEELDGAELLVWWDGDGAARVLAQDGDTVLLERATQRDSLLDIAMSGTDGDDNASLIACGVLAQLHEPRMAPAPPLRPLAAWFDELHAQARQHGGVLADCARIADELLAVPRDVLPLHGDCHHGNVLDFGEQGWLAIDPKDRIGERGFDHAQLLVNPDLPFAADPQRFARQLQLVAQAGQLDRARLAQWAVARAGLSGAWFLQDGREDDAAQQLATAQTALQALAALSHGRTLI